MKQIEKSSLSKYCNDNTMLWIQNLCRNQELRKYMKQIEKSSLPKYYNNKPNKFGCHETCSSCYCSKKFYSKKKNPEDHTKARSTSLSKEESFRKGQANVSFVARNDLVAKQCKSKKRSLTKLLQLIEDPDFDDEHYEWFDNPKQPLLVIGSQSQEFDTPSESNELEESSDDEEVLNIYK